MLVVKKDYFLVWLAKWIITVYTCLLSPNFVSAVIVEVML